jgi:hypothetical protein
MFLRAIYSVNYAAGFFASRQAKPFLSTLWRLLDQMFPRREVIIAFIGSYFATRASFNRLVEQADELQLEAGSLLWLRLSLQHVGVGIACVSVWCLWPSLSRIPSFRPLHAGGKGISSYGSDVAVHKLHPFFVTAVSRHHETEPAFFIFSFRSAFLARSI